MLTCTTSAAHVAANDVGTNLPVRCCYSSNCGVITGSSCEVPFCVCGYQSKACFCTP